MVRPCASQSQPEDAAKTSCRRFHAPVSLWYPQRSFPPNIVDLTWRLLLTRSPSKKYSAGPFLGPERFGRRTPVTQRQHRIVAKPFRAIARQTRSATSGDLQRLSK
ncbi:hypothetical protein TcG_09222 [Trypanosoma cruzi]|nr:hypothetical protein TcG_09222 [Trypanosoma cruzi]